MMASKQEQTVGSRGKSGPWQWVAGGLAVAVMLGGFACWALRRHNERVAAEAWIAFKTEWEAKGEKFVREPPVPASIPADENFAAHPWIEVLLGRPDNASDDALNEMSRVRREDGYFLEEEGESWFAKRPELAAEVLAAGDAHRSDLLAMREAAKRPGCRFPWPSPWSEAGTGGLRRIGKVKDVLVLHADAALAAGRTDEAVEDLEALLRIGAHLHRQGALLPLIHGSGAEKDTVALVDLGLSRGTFSHEQRARLSAACRSTPLLPELASILRAERGRTLEDFQVIALSGSWPVWNLRGLVLSRQNVLDVLRLSLCRNLQPVLVPDASLADWQRLVANRGDWEGVGRRSELEKIGTTSVFVLVGTIPTTLQADEDFQAMRARLAE